MISIPFSEALARDDLDDAAQALGLLLINIVPATADHPAQIIFASSDGLSTVHALDDKARGATTLVVQGAGEEAMAARVRACFSADPHAGAAS